MFKVAFRVAYRIKGRCPRHLAYDPVKDEQGGIKGECTACYKLLNAYRAYLTLREAIEKFETTVQPFITPKKARGKSVDGSHKSAPELSLPLVQRRTPAGGNSIAPEALLNYAVEKVEQFDDLRTARGIVNGLLISLVFWTCLGAVLWHSEVISWSAMAIRGGAGHGATEVYAQSSGHTGNSLAGAAWSPAFSSEWTRLPATQLRHVISVCLHIPYAVHIFSKRIFE